MPMLPPQTVQITCPQCRTKYPTPVFQMLDVGQMPDLKAAFMAGQVNVAVCPKCGTGGMIATPLVYHDPDKQFLFALFPAEVQASPQEQEQFVGAITQMIMQELPPDAPRSYLLNPRRFLTLNSLLDTILEGEGIPKEAMEAQRKRSELLGRLLQVGDDQAALQKLVEEQKAAIDYEFFLTLAAYIDAAQQDGDQASVDHFTALRDQLLLLTGMNMEEDGEVSDADVIAAVDALLAAPTEDVPQLIAEHRPALEYGFFEELTARADAARAAGNTVEAEQFEARRAEILETTEQMDRDAQALFQGAAQTLTTVLEAPELRPALVEHHEELNEAFLLVIAANIEAAERAGNTEAVERLREVERLAVEVVQEALPPEDRLIGQLLQAETPQAATKVLRQHMSMVNTDFVKRLNTLTKEMDDAGRKDVSDRLRQLSREAASILF
ncbi:MAG: CpXC domain-containing protein [Herpetosiphonaceae bacterium]|nr:CpXC domain-containing protein [Herpetosiphonaceae bacterium]